MLADGSRVGDGKSVGNDQNTDDVDYDGPIITAAGPGGPGSGGPWIWIANGTNPSMFAPPLVRRPAPPPPPEGFSADRIIESFRAEALGLDDGDPFFDELLEGETLEVEESDQDEVPPIELDE